MSFITDEKTQDSLAMYKDLVRQAGQINSQVAAFKGQFDKLRGAVTADKQAELDIKFNQFIAGLQATLGL